ncbi:NUT family member 2F [Plecturocebus cupreus]
MQGQAGRVLSLSVAPNFLQNDAVSHVPLLRHLLWGHCGSGGPDPAGTHFMSPSRAPAVWCRQEEQPSPCPSSSLPASVYLLSKAGPKAPPACLPPPRPQQPAETKAHLPPPRPQWPAETKANLPPARWPEETKAPEEISPEAVQEYMNMMDELMGPPAGATGELEGQWEEGEVEQEADGMLSDPDLWSYIDELCSEEDFITKVSLAPGYSLPGKLIPSSFCFQLEAVIHPRFLEELLSPDEEMDLFALCQELEQEEGLTLAQEVERHCLPLKEEQCMRAAPSDDIARLDSISSKSAVGQGAEGEVPDPQQGVSMESCPPQMAARDPQGQARACSGMAKTKNPIVVLERLNFHGVRAAQPDSPPQDHRPTCPGMGTKDTWGLPGASPVKESGRLSNGSSQEEREIPSIIYVVGTNHRLRPWKLSQSPVPASDLLSPEGRGPQGALWSQPVKKRGLSPAPTPATKKRARLGSPSPAQQTPHLGPGLRVSGAQSLAWGLGDPSHSPKRKGDPLLYKREKKQHRSQ